MLGMCVHLLSRYFHTVTHYSVLAEQNQPLFLFFLQKEFMPPSDRKLPPRMVICPSVSGIHIPFFCVKPQIIAQILDCGNYYDPQKSSETVESRRLWLCKSKNGYPQDPRYVDNPCGQSCGQCGKLGLINRYSGHSFFVHNSETAAYFHAYFPFLSFLQPITSPFYVHPISTKKQRKSWIPVKICCQKLAADAFPKEIFV